MKSEFKGLLLLVNVISSYDGGGEYTTIVMSSGSYWGKKKRSNQEILHNRVVYVKIKRGEKAPARNMSTTTTIQLNYCIPLVL